MPIPAHELAGSLQGLLSFPVTPFTPANEVDLPRFREHIRYMAGQNPAGLFVCGGTGEFYSLDLAEYRALVRAAVEEAGGRLPIVAGVGYGTRLAIEFARAAEQAGADGLMVMPPYLLLAEQEGLHAHYRAIAEATRLGVILYQRDNAIFAPSTVRRLAELPNVIGFKDGYGDMERLLRVRLAVGDRLLMLNGMPTAELSAPAFLGLGVLSYSSAVFNFVPEISWAFFRAATGGDTATRDRLLDGFYRPFAELRDRVRGYAVALIKAGVGITGRPVGPARPPLLDPTAEHVAELRAIVERGLALVG
jgi:5-dehydro-4-deoxyglucarate dehydratase